MSNIFAEMDAPKSTNMQDRDKGGHGLEESPWLIDQELKSEIHDLCNTWDVTPGELYRHAIKTGLSNLKSRQQQRKSVKLKVKN